MCGGGIDISPAEAATATNTLTPTSMAYRPTSNRWFSKPIITRDGTKLATVDDALEFLEALPADQVTATIYYAHVLLKEAREKGRPSNVEKARSELVRVFRDLGWL
jgi:hypothetical protein